MLEESINKQVKIAAWQLGIGLGIIIGYVLMIINATSGSYEIGPLLVLGVAIIAIAGIARFVLWIIGIVNAFKVNTITGDATILIVFSIITFWFVHLIVAISLKNKYAGRSDSEVRSETQSRGYEEKLKQSFTNGVISSEEYDKKLNEYRLKK